MEEERISTAYIPINFQSGVNILGKTYALINIVEGGALAFAFGMIFFTLLRKIEGISTSTIIGISLSIALPFGILGLTGIADEPLHLFFANVFKFFRKRRIASYNPRIKTEIKPVKLDEDFKTNSDLLPREKVMEMYEKFKNTMDERNRTKMLGNIENDNEESVKVFFEDDFGVVEKPDELLSKKELKQRRKELKRGKKKNN